MIDPDGEILSVSRQSEFAGLPRSTFYFRLLGDSPEDLRWMKVFDQHHMDRWRRTTSPGAGIQTDAGFSDVLYPVISHLGSFFLSALTISLSRLCDIYNLLNDFIFPSLRILSSDIVGRRSFSSKGMRFVPSVVIKK